MKRTVKVADPTLMPVTKPLLDTVATDALELSHCTSPIPEFTDLPPSSFNEVINCIVEPIVIDGD